MFNTKGKSVENLLTIDKETGKKIIYIVYDKENIKTAEVARNLISKTERVKCSIIENKVLYSNYKISSDNILIFLGDIKNISESRKLAVNARVPKAYGIHYGWNGRQAFIWKENIHFSEKDKRNFIAEYEKEFGKIKSKYSLGEFIGDAAMTFVFGLIGLSAKKGIEKFLKNKNLLVYGVKSYVMPLAVAKFINEDVDKFINQALGNNHE